jgi:hypothetical protein
VAAHAEEFDAVEIGYDEVGLPAGLVLHRSILLEA